MPWRCTRPRSVNGDKDTLERSRARIAKQPHSGPPIDAAPTTAASPTKIRTIRGPEPANSPTDGTFIQVRRMQRLYHQQTKNLLVAYSPKKLGFF